MKKYLSLLMILGGFLGFSSLTLATPPNISTVATDLLDLSPETCLAKAEKTLKASPMTLTTKGEDFVAGTWQDYKAMILCRATSNNKMIVIFMVAGLGNEKVELMAAKLSDTFKRQ
jgi:hypothetical protein